MLISLTPKAKEHWVTRYPCGNNGGWIRCRILEDADLLDIIQYIRAKKLHLNKINFYFYNLNVVYINSILSM